MGNRLSKIVTRTGDDGTTGLADGSRRPKHHARIEAIGVVDELNSFVGLLRVENLDAETDALLAAVQNDLFDLGGELAIPGRTALTEEHVKGLEAAVERLNADLPPLKEFILPGGSRAAALAHVCRTVSRRAERRIIALGQEEPLSEAMRQYLNRLSDLFFVLSRALNRAAGREDVYWSSPLSRTGGGEKTK